MNLRFSLAFSTLLSITALASGARAQPAPEALPAPEVAPQPGPAIPEPAPPLAFTPRAAGTRIAFGADVWPTKDQAIGTMGLTAQIAITPTAALDLDVPWAFGGKDEYDPFNGIYGKKTRAAFGNVTAGAHGVIPLAPSVAFSIGGTVSIPTRYVFQNSTDQREFVTRAAFSRGYYDAYRFGPEVVYLRVPLGLEARFARVFIYRGELVPEVWIPASDELDGRGPQLLLEHADELEARAPFGFGGGVRLQFAFALTSAIAVAPSDRLQAAIEPFLGYEAPSRGFFARLGMLTGLDSPLGFGFRSGRLLSLRMQVGFKF